MIDLTETDYTEQVFKDLDLSHREIVSKEFDDCTFEKCDFSETIFIKCRFLNCTFTHCDLSLVKIKYSSFINTVFKHSKIIGVNWSEALYKEKDRYSPVQFFNCVINHSTFTELKLQKIRIKECVAKDVDFRDSDLSGADMSHSDFTDSLFVRTMLGKSDFTGSSNYNINATLNDIKKAKFSLPEAVSLLYGLDIILDD
ncbi:MAG: pentapeptide repeat-containing protein [Candidatus Eremiobacterota bacterium]